MYSADFRCLALRLLKTFGSYHRAAKACGISTSTLHRWNTTLERRTRRMTPKRKLTLVVVDKIKQLLVESTGVLTLNHIQLHLEHSGSRLCRQTISHAVKHLCGFSRKRVSRRFGGKRDPVVQKHLVDAFEQTIRQRTRGGPTQHSPIVSVDECYFSEKVLPLYGYSPIGSKCVVTSQATSWKKRSLLLAVANDGYKHSKVHDGSINKLRFSDFIRSLPFPPNTTVILDNVAFHKDVTPFVAKGFRPLFSPPYSPDHNGPVENSFSVVKTAFRSMWPWKDGVDVCIQDAIKTLDPHHIRHMFKNLETLCCHGIKADRAP